jgi:hypothetical protein
MVAQYIRKLTMDYLPIDSTSSTANVYKSAQRREILYGFVLFLVHWLAYAVIFIYLAVGNVGPYYYFCMTIVATMLVSCFVFDECLVTTIERKLMGSKSWYGPVSIFIKRRIENMSDSEYIHQLKQLTRSITVCVGIFILLFGIFRIGVLPKLWDNLA